MMGVLIMKRILLVVLFVGFISVMLTSQSMAYVQSDSFEGKTFTPFWTTTIGDSGFTQDSLSTDFAHSGLQSAKVDTSLSGAAVVHSFGQFVQGDMSIWVNSGLPDGGSTNIAPAVGVGWVNGGGAWTLNQVPKMGGWHNIDINVSNGGFSLYIDNNFQFNEPSLTSVNSFMFLAGNSDSQYPYYYFDDFKANVTPLVTPEPVSSILFLIGGGVIGLTRLRKRV